MSAATRPAGGRHSPCRVGGVLFAPVIMLAAVIMLASAAGARAQAPVYDPIEPVNRAIFSFNRVIDGLILDPAQQMYGYAVPEPAKTGFRNFLSNLTSPITFLNDLLQGERERAGVTLGRFMINSTLGFFGVFDFASVVGMDEPHTEDLGQTLGVYGIGSGPYLVLPILGPSSTRDAFGFVVTTLALDPVTYIMSDDAALATRIVSGVDTRYQLDPALDDLERNSLDLYASTRTIYLQKREAEIRNGAPVTDDANYEDIFNEEFEESLE
ncbi:MAG: VacJ family lipoprotein [Geminicoccaceae bacterium]|nr:VacJ family lipoprotein [Geminicoccaceae bacterium]